jgi:Fur family transcriptional regulator, zinc uptake regulator
MTWAEQAVATLRDRGYRITGPRRAVLDLLERAPAGVTRGELLERLAERGESPDPVSVYRILGMLEENGLAHRLAETGRYVHCALAGDDHCHHHVICRSCGRSEEIHCPAINDLERAVARASGYRIENHRLEFTGLCGACQ